MGLIRNIFAACALMVAATGLSAATITESTNITVDGSFTSSATLMPGDTAVFNFTALEDLVVNTIAIAGTGGRSGVDLDWTEFGLTSMLGTHFTSVIPFGGGAAAAFGSLPGTIMAVGDTITIYFGGAFEQGIGVTATLVTEMPVIPVPASLPMLFAAMAVMFGIRQRSRTSA